jgi:hypothetical protein
MAATETSKPRGAFVTVFDGRTYIGAIIRRGPSGVEGYDASDNSVGVFPDDARAANEIWKRAHGQQQQRRS